MKFSFKKQPKETGLRSIGRPYSNTDIFLDKKKVGSIDSPTWQSDTHKWKVFLAVKKEKTEKDPAPFKWIKLTKQFDSESEAREYVKEHAVDLLAWDLFQFEY